MFDVVVTSVNIVALDKTLLLASASITQEIWR